MIRALFLVVDPARTWERIKDDKHGAARISLAMLLPLLVLTGAVEAWGLTQLGVERSALVDRVVAVPAGLATRFILVQLALTLLVVYGGAGLLITIGASFHRRHSYKECFTTLAYSLSPLWLLRIPDAFPAVPTWVCYGVGIFLSLSLFYRGIPFIMRPDPSSAFGLFMFCSLLLIVVTGLAHFVAVMVLQQKLLA